MMLLMLEKALRLVSVAVANSSVKVQSVSGVPKRRTGESARLISWAIEIETGQQMTIVFGGSGSFSVFEAVCFSSR